MTRAIHTRGLLSDSGAGKIKNMQITPCLLFLAAALPAVELAPGLSIGGYAEGYVRAGTFEANNPHHSPDDNIGETDHELEFSGDAALKVAYHVDRFRLRLDVLAYSEAPFVDPDRRFLIEQAFVDFEQNANLTWRGGRFQNTWLGWEAFHTPDMWRVNHSAAWDWNVQNHSLKPNTLFVSDGVGALFSTDDSRYHAEFYITRYVLGDADDKRTIDKGFGTSLWTVIPQTARVELGLAYDPRSTAAGAGETSAHAFAVDLNTDIFAFKEHGWFFATEAQFHHHPKLTVGPTRYGSDLILLAMANYAFTPEVSTTVMVDYVERGFAASDNEILETAVAILTRPHHLIRLNAEVFYWSESAENADSYGAAAVALISVP